MTRRDPYYKTPDGYDAYQWRELIKRELKMVKCIQLTSVLIWAVKLISLQQNFHLMKGQHWIKFLIL